MYSYTGLRIQTQPATEPLSTATLKSHARVDGDDEDTLIDTYIQIAREWAELKINVNTVCPGGVDTLMLTEVAHYIADKTGEDPSQIRERLCPSQLGRQVQPVEVGRVVCFLLSDMARIIRGQSISIDGGETPF